ncbi:hypothetical protein M404DRAFT_994479 [Pisolithus tinctorius Marx 270]|uniref:Uncharacterized protein n=1 Tax=Pisolithus tinctorius Marx 270 TaxID=870435 RepID=A0A0C3PRU0_PISTI|nr:hypothetical protein M404DRAFT_994479 [Pisolithus tinctorius Marx 270]
MASSPQCSAVASAMKKQGLDYAGLAAKIGSTPHRVQESRFIKFTLSSSSQSTCHHLTHRMKSLHR